MVIYEYICPKCEKETTLVKVKMEPVPFPQCPKCKIVMKRKYSPIQFSMK